MPTVTILTPNQRSDADTEVKRSRFLACLLPITDEAQLRQAQQQLKLEHPKASHVCYGFRLINDKGFISEGFSDDGEPSGTSGPPILKVMQHKHLANCGILITRYFGGTKLGTGGLQRAYGQAASEVIEAAAVDGLDAWLARSTMTISCDFSDEAALRRLLNEMQADIRSEHYGTSGPELQVRTTDESLAVLDNSTLRRKLLVTPDEAPGDN